MLGSLEKSIKVIKITPAQLIEGGDQVAAVKQAFSQAQGAQPSVLLIEEVDYIAKNKDLFYVFLA